MSLPWFKANTARALAWRDVRIGEGRQATAAEAYAELMALLVVGRLQTMGLSTVATSLGWTRGRLRRRLAEWGRDVQQVNTTPPWWRTPPGEVEPTLSEGGVQQTDSKRTPGEPSRARSSLEEDSDSEDSLSGKPDDVSPARQVWLHWKQYHPRARKLREADARKIRGRLAEDDLETCLLVADWVHLAPDAAYFRGENDQQTVYTGCATLFKADKWSQRVDRAQRWDEQGRPDTSTPSKPRPVPPPVTSMGRWEEERRLKREAYEREQAELMERIRETAKHDPEYAKMMGLA